MTRIELHSRTGADAWDGFVSNHPAASAYHLWGWRDILGRNRGHRAYYLSAWRGDRICGILPLICMSRPLLGKLLVSLPFVNYGGIVAEDAEATTALLNEALRLAERLKARSLELRHLGAQDLALPSKTHRVTMVLPLPDSEDALWRGVGSKLRNQIRKADKNGLTVRRGGVQDVPAFYEVFARNMHDLGSPTWPPSFFQEILAAFPSRAQLYLVDLDTQPVAAGLIFRFQKTVEIPWASSLREFNSLCGNVRLYWEILKDATLEGYSQFDFGRCAKDSNTYRFKQQWGARELPLHWHHWPETTSAGSEHLNLREPLEKAWSRLPIWATRLIGPSVRKWLPQ